MSVWSTIKGRRRVTPSPLFHFLFFVIPHHFLWHDIKLFAAWTRADLWRMYKHSVAASPRGKNSLLKLSLLFIGLCTSYNPLDFFSSCSEWLLSLQMKKASHVPASTVLSIELMLRKQKPERSSIQVPFALLCLQNRIKYSESYCLCIL